MKQAIIALLAAYNIYALETLNSNQVNKIVYAIGRAENSKQFPYGIRSIDTNKDINKAKAICKRSVICNYQRWQLSGKTNSFFQFMGNRYAPVSAAKVNENWIKNVEYFYNK